MPEGSLESIRVLVVSLLGVHREVRRKRLIYGYPVSRLSSRRFLFHLRDDEEGAPSTRKPCACKAHDIGICGGSRTDSFHCVLSKSHLRETPSVLRCLIPGCMFNSRPNGGHQDPNADVYIRRSRTVVVCGSETGAG